MQNLFIVNGVDFSAYISQKTYTMQKEDVFTSWEDGNHITHREVSRQRISGAFTMTFLTGSAFDAFAAALAAVKTNGYYPVSVWCNTTKNTESINAFVDVNTAHRWTTAAFGENPEAAIVKVTVTQR